VADGLAAAKVITAAALIMTAVFGALFLDGQIFLKIDRDVSRRRRGHHHHPPRPRPLDPGLLGEGTLDAEWLDRLVPTSTSKARTRAVPHTDELVTI
jgi:hypothetical protein